uniref:Cytochrome CYP443C1 n=1 Tax=Nematostella vectensis TaxID=45351 RepID=A0A6M3YRS7_NEMVE|nr:cytochrome CYP443C1 [Nematostella vectensis]
MAKAFKNRSPVVTPVSDVEQVPGSDKQRLFHLVRLVMLGQGYFRKRMEKCRSPVFRVNMGVKGVAICDRKAIDAMFDVKVIRKEPAFGRLNYNLILLDNYVPSIFTNDTPHERQKAFLMKICQTAQEAQILPTTQRVVTQYLERWGKADANLKQDWENDVRAMLSDIFTEAFLGVSVNPTLMYNMVKGSWAKPGSKLFKTADDAARLLREFLKEALQKSTKLQSLLSTAVDAGVTEEQALADILFMLNFNAYGGVSGALIGCLARLTVTDPKYKDAMRHEVISAVDKDGVTHESLNQMNRLHWFVLENLRMCPPVPLFFGRARNDFILHSSRGSFDIKADELLVGNVYEIHRDPNVFVNPEVFMPSRFEDGVQRNKLLEYMLPGNGPIKESPTASNHQCPGLDITFTVLKTALMYVVTCCDFSLTRIPIWTGKKLRRIGSPDNIVQLLSFKYSPRRPLVHRNSLQIDDLEEKHNYLENSSTFQKH